MAFTKRQQFIVFSILILISLFWGFLIGLFYSLQTKQKEPVKFETKIEEEKKEEKTVELKAKTIEVKDQIEKESIFKEMFNHDPPQIYQKRLSTFNLSQTSSFGFVKNIIIFPHPLTVFETLNIALWTRSSSTEPIEKVEGVIDFGQGKIEEIQFFPTKTIKNSEFIEKVWLGTKEAKLENKDPSISPGDYLLVLQAYDKSGKIVDQISLFLKIVEPEKIF